MGWGKFFLSAHGSTVILLLGVFAILGTNAYWNEQRKSEHAYLLRSHDLMTCVLTLSPDQRDEFRRTYRPGGESVWCPWLHGDR